MKFKDLAVHFAAVFIIGFNVCVNAEVIYSAVDQKPMFQVLGSRSNEVTIEFNCTNLSKEQSFRSEFGNGSEFLVAYDYKLLPEPGTPSIPMLQCFVKIPNTGNVTVEIKESTKESLGACAIMPYQPKYFGSTTELPYAINSQIYSTNKLYPEQAISLGSCEIWREIRVARVLVSPVMYNPVSKEAVFVKHAIITLRFSSSRGENELNIIDKDLTPSFMPLYKDVLNFDTSLLRSSAKVGCYVFLGSQATLDAVRDLINWKTRKGYDVREGVVGSDSIPATADGIDKWIENAYSKWTNKPEYLLIVGNDKVAPPKIITQDGTQYPADTYFGVIGAGGTTPVPSIHIGRIMGNKSGTTDDPVVLKYIAWKIIHHEMAPEDEAWRNQCLAWGCNSQSGNDGIGLNIEKEWTGIISKSMTVQKGTDKNPGEGGPVMSASQYLTAFNSGVSLTTYIGHGSVSAWGSLNLSTQQVDNSMTNGTKLPYVMALACNSGNWDKTNYCLYEHMLCEGSITAPKGAVTIYGYSPVSYEDVNGIISNALKNYFDSKIYHMGAAISPAKKYAKVKTDAEGGTIFGCPELDIYTINPLTALDVVHGTPASGTAFAVDVKAAGTAVSGALVGVATSKNVLLGSGFTDASGKASLQIGTIPANTDTLYVTVTGHNCKPYLKSLASGTPIAFVNDNGIRILDIKNKRATAKAGISISFYLPANASVTSTPVSAELFAMNGSRILSKQYTVNQSGLHTIVLDNDEKGLARITSGVYVLRFSCGNNTTVKSVCIR